MANIEISDLQPAGSELFSDSESYLNEMSIGELVGIQGGSSNLCWAISSYITGKAVDYLIEYDPQGPTDDSINCQTFVTATA
jgi:hypothetical protein